MVFTLISSEEDSNCDTYMFNVVPPPVLQLGIPLADGEDKMRPSHPGSHHRLGLTLQIHQLHIPWRKQDCYCES